MLKNKTILVCDDERDIVDVLVYNLSKEGYKVIPAYNGKEALEKINSDVDLVLLDIMMPYMDGLEVCRNLKQNPETQNISIIFLTARDSEIDEVKGLEIGGDDYIAKPISIKKLLARINSVLRRKELATSPEKLNLGEIKLDLDNYQVEIENQKISFPRKEFETLVYLAKNRGKIVRREQLLENVWGDDVVVTHRTIDVHIRKIREKLGKYADLIETIKGVGYRFRKEDV
ncbi:MAG: response regulator transcription factor [Ignavibacteria bacterium]|jgi:two-component system alkaline phosphatase synthesis response regulator PhoP|nr:response regulator transcription factor [Ignavibacteria bacterium]MDH7526793.1 response regulator transcription factor [Ignavibacteria bacterium]NPV11630.1 response regulator transcription factor [Ignavibacteria bacterium]